MNRKYSLIKTLLCCLRYAGQISCRGRNVFPVKVWRGGALVRIDRSARVIVMEKGKIVVGKTWAVSRCEYAQLNVGPSSELYIYGGFSIYSRCIVNVDSGAKLVLHNGYMNCDSRLYCRKHIEIGEGTIISEGVVIRDSDDHSINDSENKTKPVIIGNHVWIGQNVMVLKGVKIGDGAVIAAGAVVTRDIPDHCMAGGCPARVIWQDVSWG